LVYSLYQAGFEVYAIDFFGDVDLEPNVKDSIIISERINLDYNNSVALYRDYLITYALEMLEKHKEIDYLLIGSGLDDALKERKRIAEEIGREGYQITDLNNDVKTISEARDIFAIYDYLQEKDYNIPYTEPLLTFNKDTFPRNFPLILKKMSSSGGINVYKLNTPEEFSYRRKILRETEKEKDWIVQEYVKGIPASCTVISNGKENEIISVNRQIIGLKLLNPPKEFIYCGNIVPGRILREEENQIIEISQKLTKKLGLKGINGFDFVIKNHYPYLMEINPRIPGSIRASEESLKINLLKQHVNSFRLHNWEKIKNQVRTHRENIETYTTKLLYFAPNDIKIDLIPIINKLDYIHDQSPTGEQIQKGAPVCSILYSADTFSKSYFNALKIASNINELVN
jgi:hypothetical protein